MTGKERLIIAMNHKIPDIVPVWAQLGQELIINLSSVSKEEYYTTTNKCVRAHIESWSEFEMDGVLVDMPGRIPKGEQGFDLMSSNEEYGLINYHKFNGEVDELDVKAWGKHVSCSDIPKWWSETYKMIKREIGNEVMVGGWLPDPFAAMYNDVSKSLGRENAIMALIDYPEKIHEMLEFHLRQQIEIAKAEVEAGVDSLHISNA